jgi:hypothetical protein
MSKKPFTRQAIQAAITAIKADAANAKAEIVYLRQNQYLPLPNRIKKTGWGLVGGTERTSSLTFLIAQTAPLEEINALLEILTSKELTYYCSDLLENSLPYAAAHYLPAMSPLLRATLALSPGNQARVLTHNIRKLLTPEILDRDDNLDSMLALAVANPELIQQVQRHSERSMLGLTNFSFGACASDRQHNATLTHLDQRVTDQIAHCIGLIEAESDVKTQLLHLRLLTLLTNPYSNEYVSARGSNTSKQKLAKTVMECTAYPPTDKLDYLEMLYTRSRIRRGSQSMLAATIKQLIPEPKIKQANSHHWSGGGLGNKPTIYVTTAEMITLLSELTQPNYDDGVEAARLECNGVDLKQVGLQKTIKALLQQRLNSITSANETTTAATLLSRINQLRFLCELYLAERKNTAKTRDFLYRLIDALQTHPQLLAATKQTLIHRIIDTLQGLSLDKPALTVTKRRIANWEVKIATVCHVATQPETDMPALRAELVQTRTGHQEGNISRAELDQLLRAAIQAIHDTHGIDSDLARQIEAEFIDILQHTAVKTITESLAIFHNVRCLHEATHNPTFRARLLALPHSLRSITDKGQSLLAAITESDFTPLQKQAMLVDILYFSYKHRLQLTLTAVTAEPLKWLMAIPTVIYYLREKAAQIKLLTRVLQASLQNPQRLSDTDNEILQQLETLVEKQFNIRFESLLSEQIQQLRDKTDEFSPTDEALLLSLLKRLPASKRNDCFDLHTAIKKSQNTDFILQLCELGLDAKQKDDEGFFPHERVDGDMKTLLSDAFADKPLIADAQLVTTTAKEASTIPVALAADVSGGGGGSKESPAEDPATLKRENEQLTLDGQVTVIADNLLRQKPFWHRWTKVTFLNACCHLFRSQPSSARLGAAVRLFFLLHSCQDTTEYHQLEATILTQHGLAVRVSDPNLQLLFASRTNHSTTRPPAFNPAAAAGSAES